MPTPARFWAADVPGLFVAAIGIAFLSGYIGLLVSYHLDLASGPSIILVAGLSYFGSIVFGPNGGLLNRYFPKPHHHSGHAENAG